MTMIVTDLDRTLLRDDKTISSYTRDIFYRCRYKGIKIVIATGRPLRMTKTFIEIINPDAVVYHNGAVITAHNKTLGQYKIPLSEARMILKQIEREYPKATLSVELNEVLYVNCDIGEKTEYVKLSFDNLPNFDADKIIIGTIPIDEITKIGTQRPKSTYLLVDSGKFGMIMNKNACKWEGVKTVCSSWQIDTKNVIAFGDDYNDLEMIKNCGTGIAVNNAIDEVLAAADYVCDTNENDGVAKWLEANLL
jgi:Cof subfamily protein (haloacid dehalogenase superfamily)